MKLEANLKLLKTHKYLRELTLTYVFNVGWTDTLVVLAAGVSF